MNKRKAIKKPLNSKGASIFKKMLEEKKTIYQHVQKVGKLADLKNEFRFVKPLPTSGSV